MTDDDWRFPTTTVEREPFAGTCPECGSVELQRYPVLSDGGWYLAVKCQECLHSVSREPWHRLGTVVLPGEGIL